MLWWELDCFQYRCMLRASQWGTAIICHRIIWQLYRDPHWLGVRVEDGEDGCNCSQRASQMTHLQLMLMLLCFAIWMVCLTSCFLKPLCYVKMNRVDQTLLKYTGGALCCGAAETSWHFKKLYGYLDSDLFKQQGTQHCGVLKIREETVLSESRYVTT